MKSTYKYSLLHHMIGRKGYMPLKDAEGGLDFDRPVVILTKKSFGGFVIAELLDGDRLTGAEIAARLQQNRELLSNLKVRTAYHVMEVLLFEGDADQTKLDILHSGQFQNAPEKKFLKCISVQLTSGTIQKHFTAPATDLGLAGTLREVMEAKPAQEVAPSDIHELVSKMASEYRMEFKVESPVLAYILIGINILVGVLLYLYSTLSGTGYSEQLMTFGAKVNARILSGEYWRFVTPIFLHANVMHLLINCYSLYAVGPLVEKMFGRFRFFVVYFTAGIMGNILSFIFSPNAGVGASGAIFGLLGALLYFGLEKPALFKATFGYNVLIMIFINLAYGFSNSGIDNYAHIGGLIGGFLASGLVAEPKKTRWYFNRLLYLVLTLAIALGGLFYGFNNKQNQITAKVTELETFDRMQNWGEVETKAEEILGLNPDARIKAAVLWALAKAEALSQKYDEAEAHAKELVEIDPINGHYILGIIYYDTKQYALSREELLAAKKAGATYEQIDRILNELENIK